MLLMKGEEQWWWWRARTSWCQHMKQISDEMKDSQTSAGNSSQSQSSNNRVKTPPTLTPCRRPTLGKRMHYSPKKDTIEDKLLQKIEKKTEEKSDEDEMFCLSFDVSLLLKQSINHIYLRQVFTAIMLWPLLQVLEKMLDQIKTCGILTKDGVTEIRD